MQEKSNVSKLRSPKETVCRSRVYYIGIFLFKQITVHRMHQFIDGITKGMVNSVDTCSSIIDPMDVAIMCNIYNEVKRMISSLFVHSESEWKNLRWERAGNSKMKIGNMLAKLGKEGIERDFDLFDVLMEKGMDSIPFEDVNPIWLCAVCIE